MDLTKFKNLRTKPGTPHYTAQCPACFEDGYDRKGEHLILYEDGGFACVLYPKGEPGREEHRQRISKRLRGALTSQKSKFAAQTPANPTRMIPWNRQP